MRAVSRAVALAVGLLLSPAAAWAAPAPPEQQEFLALDYRLEISRTQDAAGREALYLRLIGECPGVEAAEEAHWALSNLYLDDFDEPKEDKAREVLELFLKRYPSSLWAPHAESRLLWLRGEPRPVQ
jgi:hypothetical protein